MSDKVKKVLFVAKVLKKHINVFHKPYLKLFKEYGYQVYVCAKNDYSEDEDIDLEFIDYYYDVDIRRNPISFKNYTVYKTLKEIIKANHFDIIHCHTPIGAALGRLAARNARKNGTKVFYTAHGFHFFKGASIYHWMIYYPIEWFLSKYTDVLITLNDEDYNRALKFKLNPTLKVYKINGVGIDLNRFQFISKGDKIKLREKYNFSKDDYILIYVAELSSRKNQQFIIKSAHKLKDKLPHLKILLIGEGIYYTKYKNLIAEYGLEEVVLLLGFRKDIPQLMNISDIAISSSKHEGLPVHLMEAMASGLPFVASDCRGNRDLADSYKYGHVYKDEEGFGEYIKLLSKKNVHLDSDLHKNNVNKYSVIDIEKEMKMIYGCL